MHRHFKSLFLTLLAVMLISCSGTSPLKSMKSMKSMLGLGESQKAISSDNFHGYYKIGDPYEIDGKWFYPKEQPDYDEYGMASWYGPEFHGKKTANGDTFDQNALTAAHKTLPLPSMVRVTNLENNKTLIVMVNDRGPFSRGRVIDLSKRAAQILDFENKGIARVRVEYLEGHTRRLLADLPKAKENPFPVAAANPESPVELMPAREKQAAENALGPLNELSSMLRNRKRTVVETTPHEGGKYSHIKIPEVEMEISEEAIPDIDSITPDFKVETRDEVTTPRKAISDAELTQELDNAPVLMAKLASADKPSSPPEISPAKKNSPSVQTDEDDETDPSEEIATEAEAPKQTEDKEIEKVIRHYIQAGTYGLKSNASRVEDTLSPLGQVMVNPITAGNRTLYQVRLGPIDDKDIATLALKKVIRLGHSDAMLVSDWATANSQ